MVNELIKLDQYFQFVKDMLLVGWLLEEAVNEPLIHSAYCVNQNLPNIQGLGKVMQL